MHEKGGARPRGAGCGKGLTHARGGALGPRKAAGARSRKGLQSLVARGARAAAAAAPRQKSRAASLPSRDVTARPRARREPLATRGAVPRQVHGARWRGPWPLIQPRSRERHAIALLSLRCFHASDASGLDRRHARSRPRSPHLPRPISRARVLPARPSAWPCAHLVQAAREGLESPCCESQVEHASPPSGAVAPADTCRAP